MEGNTPFRLWKCDRCEVELDEADGYNSNTIDGREFCDPCANKIAKELIGIVECRKCGKTYAHPHKCTPSKNEIEDLKDMACGLSMMVVNLNKELTALKEVLRKVGRKITALLDAESADVYEVVGKSPEGFSLNAKGLARQEIQVFLTDPEVVKVMEEKP